MSERKTVLLIYPNHYSNMIPNKWLPTSLVFLAATLTSAGYNPILVDDRFDRQQTLDLIDTNIDDTLLVGIGTATGSQLRNARQLAEYVKICSDIPVVFGGSFPSAKSDLMLDDPNVDCVIPGPGAWSIAGLCELSEENDLAFQEPWVTGPISTPISVIPLLPYSTFINLPDYINPSTKAINYTTCSGCVGNCGFCYWHESHKYSRFRSNRVEEDLQWFRSQGIRNITFDDGTFFTGRVQTMQIVERLKNLDLQWRANGRVDTLTRYRDEDWKAIKESGCHLIHIGLEHVSPSVLNLMHKYITPNNAWVLMLRAREAGITLRFHILVGNPMETLDDLRQVGAFVQKMQDTYDVDHTVNWFTPYPGCTMTSVAKEWGYEEPTTLEGFEKIELMNYLHLPDDDRKLVSETSPWEEDYYVPWFTKEFNKDYMRVFREVMPRGETIETTNGKIEEVYGN